MTEYERQWLISFVLLVCSPLLGMIIGIFLGSILLSFVIMTVGMFAGVFLYPDSQS